MEKREITPKDIADKETQARLKAMNRTDTEKFYFLTSLIKTQRLMNKMEIIHKS
jgi:hypothetical protein